jgi:hypothetical protein
VTPLQDADASLAADAPAPADAEPPLLFLGTAGRRARSVFRQHHAANAASDGRRLVLRRGKATVRRRQVGRSAKECGMAFKRRPPQCHIRWAVLVHRAGGDNLMIDLRDRHQSAELGRPGDLAFEDHPGVWLEHTHDFVGHTGVPAADPLLRLRDDASDQPRHPLQRRAEPNQVATTPAAGAAKGNPLAGSDGFSVAVVAPLLDTDTDLVGHIDTVLAYDHVVLVDVIVGTGRAGDVAVVDEGVFGSWSDTAASLHHVSPLVAVKLFRTLYPEAATRLTLIIRAVPLQLVDQFRVDTNGHGRCLVVFAVYAMCRRWARASIWLSVRVLRLSPPRPF